MVWSLFSGRGVLFEQTKSENINIMTPEYAKEIVDSFFPIGKPRWLRIIFLDQDKCINALRLSFDDARDAERGYSVCEHQGVDEFIPMVDALNNVRKSLMIALPEHFSLIDSVVGEEIKLFLDKTIKQK